MSSTPGPVVVGDGVQIAGQDQSQKTSASGRSDEITSKETTNSTPELIKGESVVLSSAQASSVIPPTKQSADKEDEEIESIPSTSTVSIQAVESSEPKSTGSADAQPIAGRILLKRRRSRISMPTLGPRSVAEETDSAPPRSSRRRTQKKKMIALFSESDYPRRK